MLARWYRTGVIYSVDVGLFQDANDDGMGDFQGLAGRLDYLPVVADAGFLCVESQQHDPGSTFAFVCRLIHLRSREPTLQSGAHRLVGAAPDVFCFERQLDQRFLVVLNFSSRRVPVVLADDTRGPAVLELSTRPEREHGPVDLTNLVLEPTKA